MNTSQLKCPFQFNQEQYGRFVPLHCIFFLQKDLVSQLNNSIVDQACPAPVGMALPDSSILPQQDSAPWHTQNDSKKDSQRARAWCAQDQKDLLLTSCVQTAKDILRVSSVRALTGHAVGFNKGAAWGNC